MTSYSNKKKKKEKSVVSYAVFFIRQACVQRFAAANQVEEVKVENFGAKTRRINVNRYFCIVTAGKSILIKLYRWIYRSSDKYTSCFFFSSLYDRTIILVVCPFLFHVSWTMIVEKYDFWIIFDADDIVERRICTSLEGYEWNYRLF